MAKRSKPRGCVSSLLDGTDEFADAFLNLNRLPLTSAQMKSRPLWQGRGVCIEFSRSNSQFQDEVHVYCLLKALMAQIELNWKSAQNGRWGKPSAKNWRWDPQVKIAPKNNSPEVLLERAIAQATLEKAQGVPAKAEWSNHIPTCAGYLSSHSDGQTCIDIARRHKKEEYSLFELKWNSNTPLYATVQLIRYFLVYLFTRCRLKELGYSNHTQPMLKAKSIHLGVLAPAGFYSHKIRGSSQAHRFDMGWFAKLVEAALQKFIREFDPGVQWPRDVSFAYYQLPAHSGSLRNVIAKTAQNIVNNPSSIGRAYP